MDKSYKKQKQARLWRSQLCLLLVVDVMIVEDLRVPAAVRSYIRTSVWRFGTYIMIFQVSTGKSASLNDQSNFSSAAGSSVGS